MLSGWSHDHVYDRLIIDGPIAPQVAAGEYCISMLAAEMLTERSLYEVVLSGGTLKGSEERSLSPLLSLHRYVRDTPT